MRNKDHINHFYGIEDFENEISFLKYFKGTNIVNLIEYNYDIKEPFYYTIYEKT